jgi:hypothetical protein
MTEGGATVNEVTVKLTARQLAAVNAAIDGYTAHGCTNSDHYNSHGDETDCDGWGPKGLRSLDTGADRLLTAERKAARS